MLRMNGLLDTKRRQGFETWIIFCLQVREKGIYSVGTSERANFNHWTND
jgi:hypothetical protein